MNSIKEDTSDEKIKLALDAYGVQASPHLCASIREYISILLRWNRVISLTTVEEPAEILKFHFGESLFTLSAVPIEGGRLADVGSGAGFPGLPLAMVNPSLSVDLIESNLKKATFLSEVIRKLQLTGVNVLKARMEDLPRGVAGYDFVTARALGHHRELLSWASGSLADDGKLVLWIGEDEANAISREHDWTWCKPIHIPGSTRRFLLVGTPTKRDE